MKYFTDFMQFKSYSSIHYSNMKISSYSNTANKCVQINI